MVSIDTESSVGCNTVVGSREGTIYRITPRRNDAVNDTWMPDSGRELYKAVDSDDRLNTSAIEGRPVPAGEAISVAALMALKRRTGARGLRSIIEEALLEVMYEVPSSKTIKKCVISLCSIGPSTTIFAAATSSPLESKTLHHAPTYRWRPADRTIQQSTVPNISRPIRLGRPRGIKPICIRMRPPIIANRMPPATARIKTNRSPKKLRRRGVGGGILACCEMTVPE